jgi:ABC-type nickel/cobalt efflux system permease component RcnA
MGSGAILAALIFFVPGLLIAVVAAFLLRHTRRFRSWVRITLILTVLGTIMWTLTNRYMAINVGSLQVGSMAAVVALFSALISFVAVWMVPRKKNAVVDSQKTELPKKVFQSGGDGI